MLTPFYAYLRFEKRFSEHTITAYTQDLNQFLEYSPLSHLSEFNELTTMYIRGWMVSLIEKGYDNKSVNRKLATLRTLYKWLKQGAYVTNNPVQRISGPKTEKRLPSFAREQELNPQKTAQLFDASFNGKRDELMLEIFYQTGIRLSELIGLTVDSVQQQTIKVLGKRNKERIIPISQNLSEKIQYYLTLRAPLAKTNKFFILDNGKPLYAVFVYRKIHALLGSVSHLDKRSPHVLRHTFATHMLNHGAGLETLQALLGHASLAATQVYTHNSFAQINQIYRGAHPRMKRA